MVISWPAALFEAGVRDRLAVAAYRLLIRIDEPIDVYIYYYFFIYFFNLFILVVVDFSEESDIIRV